MRPRTPLTPAQQLTKDLAAMNDSKLLVERLINETATSEDDVDTLGRNYRHLEIMLQRENILESGEDLTLFEVVVNQAKSYIEGLTT